MTGDVTSVELRAGRTTVPCPICLAELDWESLPPHSLDPASRRPQPLDLAEARSPHQRRALLRSAVVACPSTAGIAPHTLPYAYGQFGRPVIIGLVGQTDSGKTHLLSALVKALDEAEAYRTFGVQCIPVDQTRHRRVVDDIVRTLFAQHAELPPTGEGRTSFTDAFRFTRDHWSRTVAIFDVAGGDLQSVEVEKRFLHLADGLLFAADPTALAVPEHSVLGDLAVTSVLDLLGGIGRSSQVCAAVAVTKADKLRFEEPIDFWMRQPVSLDPASVLAESRDLYAYLHSRRGFSWLRPVTDCARVTLHAVSATGGSSVPGPDTTRVFPRGVYPQRVLGPLGALLVMTGVLPAPGAETMGVL